LLRAACCSQNRPRASTSSKRADVAARRRVLNVNRSNSCALSGGAA
jgi:hypothetical protein